MFKLFYSIVQFFNWLWFKYSPGDRQHHQTIKCYQFTTMTGRTKHPKESKLGNLLMDGLGKLLILIDDTLTIICRLTSTFSLQHRLIFSDKTSRNLFLFLLLNLSFAFVELFYGIWTNRWGILHEASGLLSSDHLPQLSFSTISVDFCRSHLKYYSSNIVDRVYSDLLSRITTNFSFLSVC